MIKRNAQAEITELLREFPAVAVLGPRQVGKTTLAWEIARTLTDKPVYLDLETPSNLNRLAEPEDYFNKHKERLVVLDEIQRVPELFRVLRGVIDERRREGQTTGQFLILGSASLDLLQQSSETLAGRIAYKELTGLTTLEIPQQDQDKLWLRGGFPDSFLATSNQSSLRWRMNFIGTYLERDHPQFGPRIPTVTLRRLWTMLAHSQSGQINIAQIGANLDMVASTAKRYLELLEDLLLIRTLRPWSGNIGKRLVKAPKIYIRDSGLTHALLNIVTLNDLLGHPIVGGSWEGFVIENILSVVQSRALSYYYRTSAGAEIDLILEFSGQEKWAIEIKRSSAPALSKGFHIACEDIKADRKFVIYSGNDRFSLGANVTAISVAGLMREILSKIED